MLASLVLALLTAATDRADDAIVLSYYDRPPYMVAQPDGSAAGLTADPAAALFTRAGIPFRWQMTPAKRQLNAIKDGPGHDCGIGWFRTAERSAYAAFIGPIYRDKPAVLLAGPGFPLQPDKPVEQLLTETRTPVLIKDGLTYGRYVAELIQRTHLETVRVPAEQWQMVEMLLAGRADVMFATREEADLLVAARPVTAATLRIVALGGDELGDERYIMCSKKLDPRIIDALKAALDR